MILVSQLMLIASMDHNGSIAYLKGRSPRAAASIRRLSATLVGSLATSKRQRIGHVDSCRSCGYLTTRDGHRRRTCLRGN